MSKPAAIPLFGDAYMADTRHLSLEEHGAYLMLLMVAWRTDSCSLPNDDRRLARMLGIGPSKWAKLKPSIMAFWSLVGDTWTQARLTKERKFVDEKRATNSSSAKARWDKQEIENKESGECERISERNAPTPSPPEASSDRVAKATPSQRARRAVGVRIPPDWKPSALPPKVAALVAQWPDGRADRECDNFHAYWLNRVKDATRINWDSAWHNRIGDIHDRVLRDNRNGRTDPHQQHHAPSGRSIGRTEAAARAVLSEAQPYAEGRSPDGIIALPYAVRS